MTSHTGKNPLRGRRLGWSTPLLALAVAAGVAGCDGLLDVDNPNSLVQEDLENPASASAAVSGARATVARAVSRIVLAHSVVTDELAWVGSYDSGRELDFGYLSNPTNEFNNNEAFAYVGEARWMAHEAVRLLEGFDNKGTLKDRGNLAQAYLQGAIAYGTVADHYDDFAFSDRREAGPPIGEQNMAQVYDAAIEYLDKGLAVAQALPASHKAKADLELAILAVRARTHFARAVWTKLNPKGSTPADPLVDDAAAVADAQAVLARVGTTSDWKYRFTYAAATVANTMGAWVNERQEFRVGNAFGVPNPDDNKKITGIALKDPIDGVTDPALSAIVNEFLGSRQYAPMTVVSAREMHLILAEAALASGIQGDFAMHVNHVRAMDKVGDNADLTPYSGQIPALDMLEHERTVNLFFQGRRLADLYRFGEKVAEWQANSDAVVSPGTFFPIADIELKSNCHLAGGC